uniref:Aminotransferase-like plant mobile domain-containing protein n=1 Tax=Oryza rufipogon TaxID=4529 RepID=A0A0E0QAF1_ORYRU
MAVAEAVPTGSGDVRGGAGEARSCCSGFSNRRIPLYGSTPTTHSPRGCVLLRFRPAAAAAVSILGVESTCCIFVSDFVSVCFFSRMPDWCSGSNFKHRWGGVRFKRTMLQLEPDQKQFIIDNGFESFLSLNNFKVHSRLAEWIMQKMNPEICEFRFRGKVIVFDKLLVQKITGLNDGDLPVKLSGANSEVVKEIRTLYHPYFVSNRLGTGMCEKLLLSLHDEEKFLRTFILYLLATILCPATGNYVNLDYVHSLVDVQMWS